MWLKCQVPDTGDSTDRKVPVLVTNARPAEVTFSHTPVLKKVASEDGYSRRCDVRGSIRPKSQDKIAMFPQHAGLVSLKVTVI